MESEILILEKNERVQKILEKILEYKNLKSKFVETGLDCLDAFQNSLDEGGRSGFDFVILEKSTFLPNGEKLEEKIQSIDIEEEVFFLGSNKPLEINSSKEISDLVEKPFSLISLLSEIEIKNQTAGQQILV